MKTFVLLLALVCMAVFFCCAEDISDVSSQQILLKNDQDDQGKPEKPKESALIIEEEAELVELRMPPMSSAYAWLITMRYLDENVVFFCKVENGHFVFAGRSKNVSVHSGDKIIWMNFEIDEPSFRVNDAIIEIVLKLEANIVGYVVIEVKNGISSNLIKSVLFPQIDSKYQNVSEEYVKTAIEKAKAESKEG